MVAHFLHIYQRPALGNNLIKRFQCYGYKHTISAVGGFDTASCALAVSKDEGETILEQFLGCRYAVFVDNPVEPIHEGLITRVTFDVANVTFTNSLENMYNRVVVATGPVGTAVVAAFTAAADDNESQAIYGIKQGTVDALVQYTNIAGTNVHTALRDHLIAVQAWPQSSVRFNPTSKQLSLKLDMQGFFHTLEWEHYASATATSAGASTIVGEVIAGLANGTTFFDNSDTSEIDTNAAFNQARLSRNGLTAWEFLKQIQEAGNAGATRWVMGISPTDFNRGDRVFYYQAANSAIEYTARLREGPGIIRNIYGGRVLPWNVRPDRSIRLMDVLTGWNLQGDDPRESYIEKVTYDAESQTVQWVSSDDMGLEGRMQFARIFKPHATRFGAPPRSSE